MPVLLIAYSIYCGVTRMYLWRFNLHKTNAANEELVISLKNGRVSPRKEADIPIAPSLYSLSNKMDNSLLAVRDINHKYIVVEKEAEL